VKIGILALQGGYAAHATVLSRLNVDHRLVRNSTELADADAVILPGGESSVFIKLLQENGLWGALMDYKKPILGTCAGAILLAKNVSSPEQATLNRIGMSIERNAYGRQLASQITTGTCLLTQREIEMVFIRAPKITAIDKDSVKTLATLHGQPMAVQKNNCIAATFHPELSLDDTLHTYFIQLVGT
jgi:5'-phosphate synthase pdxT subunit